MPPSSGGAGERHGAPKKEGLEEGRNLSSGHLFAKAWKALKRLEEYNYVIGKAGKVSDL